MSHPAHFYDAPARPDRGRRLIPTTSLYQSHFDYLKDQRPLSEQTTPTIGTASSSLKFHRGFWRRPAAAIAADAERVQHDRDREQRQEARREGRMQHLLAHEGECQQERDWCQHRRHFLDESRGPSPLSAPTPPGPSPPPSAPHELHPTMRSHILGVHGRGDLLPSYGVPDAFMGDRYADYAYVPVVERKAVGRREGGGGGGCVQRVCVDLAAERRVRDVERERNARKASQLGYLFDAQERKEQLH